jgi:phosphonate transport system substrate-binding protein
MVLDGRAEAAAIDSTVLDMASAGDPGLPGRIRTVQTLGPHPAPPWVIARSLPQQVRARVRDWLCGLHRSRPGRALLSPFRIDCFARVQDQDYDPIRAAAQMAGHLLA